MKIYIALLLFLLRAMSRVSCIYSLRMRGFTTSSLHYYRRHCFHSPHQCYRKLNRVYSSIPLPASSDIPDVSDPSILSSLYSFTYDSLPDETLYILDGTSMLFHAYYSRENGDINNSKLSNEVVAAVIKSIQTDALDNLIEIDREKLSNLSCGPLVVMAMHFARLVRDVKPKYITVAFDSGKHLLERRLAYPEYKKNRAQTPVELLPLIVLAPSIFEALGCKCIKLVGHEADDLMASVGNWARLRGLNVVHVSQDKDLLQLVGTGVHVMIPKGREMMGAEQVVNKFGVSPELFRDYQAIMGDATDNIPGVGGLGPVAAAALVNHFKCVDAMCTSLRLPGLAPPPPELLSPNPNWKKLALHLQNLLSEDVYHNIALPELTKALANTKSMKASTVLAKLYICGHDNLLLYRRLVTLKDDLEISEILHYSNSARVSISPNNSRSYYFSSSSDSSDSSGANDGGAGPDSSDRELESDDGDKAVNSNYFRYIGEEVHAMEYLKSIHPSLLRPLQLLREQYHNLERRI